MILIADSGSTKTDWCVASEGRIARRIATQGINPFHQTQDAISSIISDELLPQMDDDEVWNITSLHFYGSGCRGEKITEMSQTLARYFTDTDIECHGDLLAAARAVCGRSEGIACILGTGSNSCLYDGDGVVENVPPMGYILGDEGSGAVLGRLFLNALYKGRLSQRLRKDFEQWSGLTLDNIINKVYREPLANRFLASLCPFISHNMSDDALRELVVGNFRSFLRFNVARYGRPDLPVGAIGSVAFYFREQLSEAARAENFTLGQIVRSPMEGLVAYHR